MTHYRIEAVAKRDGDLFYIQRIEVWDGDKRMIGSNPYKVWRGSAKGVDRMDRYIKIGLAFAGFLEWDEVLETILRRIGYKLRIDLKLVHIVVLNYHSTPDSWTGIASWSPGIPIKAVDLQQKFLE